MQASRRGVVSTPGRNSTRLAVAGLISGATALFFAALAFRRARLPYNEEGNYFDGTVNTHQQSGEVFALLAAFALVLAMVCWWVYRRSRRRG